MTRRLLAVAGLLLSAFAFCATPALAADSASDPSDGGKLDVKRVSDSVDANIVTYRVETYGGFDDSKDFYIMRWFFDLDGDGKAVDMCIRLEKVLDGPLRATLYPKCGPSAFATADATKPASNTVEFQFRTVDLVDAGMLPGKPVGYFIRAVDMNGKIDTAPDHGLIQQSPLPKPVVPGRPTQGGGSSIPNELAQSGSRPGNNSVPNELAASGGGHAAAGQASSGASTEHKGSPPPLVWIVAGIAAVLVAVVAIVLVLQRRLVWVDVGAEDDPAVVSPEPTQNLEPAARPGADQEEGDAGSPRVHTHDA